MARERNILTVGVVTKPFSFEGSRRARSAEQGIDELQQYVDTLIVIPNQNLFRMANERTTWKEAFKMADHVLYMGVRGVTDLMMAPGLVNLDFADIRTVMAEMGKAMMGTGEADGENRSIRAAEAAISNPLLEDTSMNGARGLLINITGGEDMTLFEVDQAANRIREEVDDEANIIFGSAIDDTLQGKIRVSVVATGIDRPSAAEASRPRLVAVGGSAVAASAAGSMPPGAPIVPGTQHGQHGMAPTVGQGAAYGAPHGAGGAGPALTAPMVTPLRAVAQASASHAHYEPTPDAQAGAAYPQAHQAAAGHAHPAPASYGQPRSGTAGGPAPHTGARGGLFADPSRAPAATQPEGQSPPAEPRPSLFRAVTGRLRNSFVSASATPFLAEAPPMARVEPVQHEPRPEPARAAVRPTGSEEMGLEIPAFLRRQS
jgi:cell division protein FtsZ